MFHKPPFPSQMFYAYPGKMAGCKFIKKKILMSH